MDEPEPSVLVSDVPEHPGLIRAVLQAVGDPLWIVDRELRLTHFNPPFAALCQKVLQVTPSAGVSIDALLDPERYPAAGGWWRELGVRVFDGRSVAADMNVVVDGLERFFILSGYPAFWHNSLEHAVFTARDVTDTGRVEREDLLELAVARIFAAEKPLDDTLAEVLEFVCESDGWDCAVIWLVDSTGMHLAPEVVWSRPDLDLTKFRDRVFALRFTRGHGVPGRAWDQDDVVWISDVFDETGFVRGEAAAQAGLHGAAAMPLRDAAGIIGVLEMLTRAVRPMSEQRRRALRRAGQSLGRLIVRRQLQQVIERKGQEWSLTFDAIELPIFITRLDGTIVRVNRAARDVVGGEFQDVLGRNIAVAEAEPWKTLADVVVAVRDTRASCTARIAERDRFWDVSGSWYTSATDGEDRAIVVMRDTTELIRLEESVRRGEQMAALGELVAGVAHEVRNPIFGIGLTVDTLQQMLPSDPEVDELVGVLRTWLDRLNRLMENLLAYGKSWTLSLTEGDLVTVITPTVERCRQIATQASIAVDMDLAPDLLMLMDGNRLGHAFENLVINAIQHSRPQQRVLVTAHPVSEGGREWIECSVRDRGPGFEPTDLPRIFEPFFTKRRGGTGLGLSIVQRVVDEHGGTIDAGNASDGGAVVTIRFPIFRGTPC